MRQTQASSNPLHPVLIARRARKHLDELEVIGLYATEPKSRVDFPCRDPTTQMLISILTRPMAQLKVQGVVDGVPLVRP